MTSNTKEKPISLADAIIEKLASKPLSAYDLERETKRVYPRVHETIKRLLNEGHVKLEGVKPTKTGGTKKVYTLTFKGVLKYLSTFTIPPILLPKVTEKDLLNVLEKQGEILDYAPFKEIRWLSERVPGIIKLFINQAKNHLNPSLNSTGQFADTLSKNLSNPDLHLGVDGLRELRGAENSFLKDAFGKTFLKIMVGRIKKDSENEKLRQFAERILNENKSEIARLEQAVALFSARFP